MVRFGQPRPVPTTLAPRPFDRQIPDGYEFFLELGPLANVNREFMRDRVEIWNQLTQHPNRDEFWQCVTCCHI